MTDPRSARHLDADDDAPAPDPLATVRTGTWLTGQDYPPVQYVVPGLLPEGLVLLAASPKVGKSWLAHDIGLAAASGGTALGFNLLERPALYLALEDGPRRLKDRAATLGYDQIPHGWHFVTELPLGVSARTLIAAWLDTLDRDGPAPLVVVDTLGRSKQSEGGRHPTESPYDHDYRVGSGLKRLADSWPGTCLLVIHHDRKAGADDFVDSVSGTNGLAGSADAILLLRRDRGADHGTLHVVGRDISGGEYALGFDAGRWSLDGGSLAGAATAYEVGRTTENLGDRAADIVEFVARQPGPVRAPEVADELGLAENQARTYLSRLANAGRLDRPERGEYVYRPPVANVASVALEPGTSQNATLATHATGDISDTCTVCGEPLTDALKTGVHPLCEPES